MAGVAATELAKAVLQKAASDQVAELVIATVDIPNIGSVKVPEKLGFEHAGQIHAYGGDEMYLYELSLLAKQFDRPLLAVSSRSDDTSLSGRFR